MSRFYAELHDRELIAQAEVILGEVQRRNLVDVFLPAADSTAGEQSQGVVFPRRLSQIAKENGKLALTVESNFFAHSSGS